MDLQLNINKSNAHSSTGSEYRHFQLALLRQRYESCIVRR